LEEEGAPLPAVAAAAARNQPERGYPMVKNNVRLEKVGSGRLCTAFVGVVLLALSASACSGDNSSEAGASTESAQGTTETGQGTTTEGTASAGEVTAEDFDASLFDDSSTTIDNEWFPLKPGTRWVWKGSTEEDEGRVPHSIVFTITDLTKEINGVRTVVGWDRDFSDGELVETELIFLAQDTQGNIWHLGQYSEAHEEGEFVGGSAWIAGLEGAKPGIWVKADPQVGQPAYSMGFAPPPFYWDDYAKTFKMGQRTCVPAGCFEDVLVTDEFEPGKPGAHQLKYYARGVGNIRTGWRGEDADKEVLVLTRVAELSPAGLAKARSEALKLENRAYTYGRTPPAEPLDAESP
jgi:hypothetical protein